MSSQQLSRRSEVAVEELDPKDGHDTAVHIDTVVDFEEIAEHVSFGHNGIRGIVESPYVFAAALLISFGGFSWGYDQGVISIINVMPQFHREFPETDPATKGSGFYLGFMTGMLELGAFVGCFFMPKLADTISRKWALTVVAVIFNIGAIIQTAAKSYGVLVAGRTICGIGVGTLAMGAPLYISEVAPANVRGALLVLEAVSVVLGIVIAYWITFATRHIPGQASFRLPFGLQMVCSTILGTCIHFLPYSPRWLSLVGRHDDALKSLSRLRQLPPTDERLLVEWRGIIAEVEFQKLVLERNFPGKKGFSLEFLTWLELFRKKNWRRTVVACGIAFFQQFSGINGFIYYAPILFSSLGQSDDMSLILSGVLNVWQLVAITLCFFIIDHIGRRPLSIFGGFGSMVPYVVMAILVWKYSSDWTGHPAAAWTCVAMAFIYILTYGSTYAPLGWTLPAEAYTTANRSKGVALATACLWLSNFAIGVAVPPMVEDAGYGTYVFFALMCLLAGIWAYLFVPETKGRSLEELAVVFKDNSATQERALLGQALQQARTASVNAVHLADSHSTA
ncbi:hexose carrier protein, partial [Aureobasidium melanogenum]